MERLDIVRGISQMSQGTSQPGSKHIRLGSVNQQSNTTISCFEPSAEADTLPSLKAKPVEPLGFYTCL